MPTFLYKIQAVRPAMLTDGPTSEEAESISQHFKYLTDLTKLGVVILAGPTTNTDYSHFGIVIFNADTEDMARQIMNDDPVVKNRVARAELHPYKIELYNPNNIR